MSPFSILSPQRLVLVVDDDAYIINVFTQAFQGQDNFLLDIAMTVQLALQKIRAAVYDLIFLDMNLGHSQAGMEVLSDLRRLEIEQQAKGHPFLSSTVIIMSGSISLNDITQEAHGLEVFHFIDKPIPMTPEFVRRVVNRFGIPLLPPPRLRP